LKKLQTPNVNNMVAMDVDRKRHSIKSTEENLMWVEKYRPKSLDEVLSHKDIMCTLKRLVQERKLPHLLFYGPPGTGKTTSILAVARELNGPQYKAMTLELNASDDRGIDVVRNQIKTFASTKQIWNKGFKIIILDEADSMTNVAQFALRRVIEQYTKNTRFCMICNYVNKIKPALQSRCTRFRFGPLDTNDVLPRLREIAKKEGVKLTEDGLKAIVKLAVGDMRKCLNVMQSAHMSYPEVNRRNVYLCTGAPMPEEIDSILHTLLNQPFSEAYRKLLKTCTTEGLALIDVVEQLSEKAQRLQLSGPALGFLFAQLSDLEHRLSKTCNVTLQLGSLIAIFHKVKIFQKDLDDKKPSEMEA